MRPRRACSARRVARRPRGALVGGIGVGVDEDDRERLSSHFEQGPERRRYHAGIDRRPQGAVGKHAFVDLEALSRPRSG